MLLLAGTAGKREAAHGLHGGSKVGRKVAVAERRRSTVVQGILAVAVAGVEIAMVRILAVAVMFVVATIVTIVVSAVHACLHACEVVCISSKRK